MNKPTVPEILNMCLYQIEQTPISALPNSVKAELKMLIEHMGRLVDIGEEETISIKFVAKVLHSVTDELYQQRLTSPAKTA